MGSTVLAVDLDSWNVCVWVTNRGTGGMLTVLLSVHLNARKAIMITATLLVSYVPSDREIAKTKLV